MSAPRIIAVDLDVTFDDGQSAKMAVDIQNGGASWGNDTPHLGATVELREAIHTVLLDGEVPE